MHARRTPHLACTLWLAPLTTFLLPVLRQGGETAALARLRYYFWDSDLIATYFDVRNGMLGGDYSTKV